MMVPDYKDALMMRLFVDTDGDGLRYLQRRMLNAATEDLDDDGDGVSDAEDAFPLSRYATADSDGDGAPDELQSDPRWFMRPSRRVASPPRELQWSSEG